MHIPSRIRKMALLLVVLLLLVGGFFMPTAMPHIQLPAEPVLHITLPVAVPLLGHEFVITNTILAAWLSMLILIVLSLAATRQMKLLPTGLQNMMEAILEAILNLVESVAGRERGRKFFPLVATIFLFVLVSNWMGLLPGYGTIGRIEEIGHEGYRVQEAVLPLLNLKVNILTAKKVGEGGSILVPFLRSAATDLNFPLALALVTVLLVQYFGVRAMGALHYAAKFFNFGRLFSFGAALVGRRPRKGLLGQLLFGFLDVFVGMIELISEFAKVISFSFRLFGNVMAGEILLAVMAFLIPWVASLPFLGLELFVGFIQAFIFAVLALAFLAVATTGHSSEEAH
ncbi:MAG: F0F1 ATP synthase subunit A [Chloroflexi bacterium]|nr:F0F1 ATP synthase subunit A [Chloroflexota bacterium]